MSSQHRRTQNMAKKIKLKDPTHGLSRGEMDEVGQAMRKMQEVARASLTDRQEARKAFGEAMAEDPALVAERVGWLIDGNYGFGEMIKAKQVIASPRMNRRAALTQMVGVYEWNCPGDFGVDAWKKLTGGQKAALDAALDVVIEAAEAEMASEQG
jgi:hypothetical protein